MIYAMLWKEYREHRIAWIAMAVVGAGVGLGLPAVAASGGLADDPEVRWRLCLTAVAVAWAYGVICGAMLLAGEREMGTLPFLDALPGLRRQLWFGKWTAGVVLVLAQTVLLMSLLAVCRLLDDGWEAAAFLGGMALSSLYGLAWGMLFSAIGRNVMNMILLALATQVAIAFIILLFAAILSGILNVITGSPVDMMVVFSVGLGILSIPLVFACSAAAFTDVDRGRLRPPALAALQSQRAPRAGSVLYWLAWRQARGFAGGMMVFALVLGFLVLYDGVALWPITTLLVGVLCGATAFADEQQGPFRFLGDQRLPLGKVWMVKVFVRFLIAAAACLVMLTPSFLIALGTLIRPGADVAHGQALFFLWISLFRSAIVSFCPPELFLTMWLINGFCAGCLCGVLFRSGLASGVFALFLGSVLSSVWVPSLLRGGLHAWQVLGPPLLLLMTSRLLLRPWSAGRIASMSSVVRLAPCALLAVLWIVGGLAYRVWEVPDVAQKYDVEAFRHSLPTLEENAGGELIRSACLRFEDQKRMLQPAEPPHGDGPGAMPPAPGMPPQQQQPAPPAPPKPEFLERAIHAQEHGWPVDDPEFAVWLDKLFASDWVQKLKDSVSMPLGMVEDLRNETNSSMDRVAQPAREIGLVLAARGLQRQAAGDDETAVENLRIGLHLARAMRRHAPALNVLVARSIEGSLTRGLDRWLENLNGRPDLLHEALDLLSDYQDRTAEDEADQTLVDYLISRNTLDDPNVLTREMLSAPAVHGMNDDRLRTEAQWMTMAGLVPWEKARQERILRVFFGGTKSQRDEVVVRQSLVKLLCYSSAWSPNFTVKPDVQCRHGAMRLKLALRWVQAAEGKPVETLDELLPKYLPVIPLDAYDGQPFRYRLSHGEEIEWPEDSASVAQPPAPPAPGGALPGIGLPGPPPPPPTRKIPAGQGILWCVGPDKKDDGGHRQLGRTPGTAAVGEDLIFLVPLPKQK